MRRRIESGMATAEYCVGSIGAALIGFWLWRLGSISGDHNIFERMIRALWSHFFADDNWIWQWLT